MTLYCLRVSAIFLLAGVALAQDPQNPVPAANSQTPAAQQAGQDQSSPPAGQKLPDAPSQQVQQPAPASPPAQPSAPQSGTGAQEGHERVAFIIPAFGVTNNQNAPP